MIVAMSVITISLSVFMHMEKSAELRKNTFIVLNNADDLLSELVDAETGQRGYLLTDNETFLKPYLAVRDSISSNLGKLRQISLSSAANKHLDALRPLIDAKLAYLARNIELYSSGDIATALANVRGGQDKRLMDSIRSEMKSFVLVEQGALAQHDAQFQGELRILFIFIVIASLLILLFSLSFVYLIYRETDQRLKNLVHLETKHLLDIQEKTNNELQLINTALQISEEKFAVTLSSIGDAVMATDAEGRVTFLNAVAEKLTGWMQAKASGRPSDEIFNIINEETRQPSASPIREVLSHGTAKNLANHTILIARGGGECAIADSCAPILNREGRVFGAVLVFRDVTERKAVEDGLEKTRKELEITKISEDADREYAESIINTVREPLIVLDQDLRVVTASRSFYEVFKVNTKETVGQLIYDLGNKQWNIPKLRELLETILPQKTTFDNYEVEHDFTAIGRRIMLLDARQIQRVLGKERIILLAIEDITERKKAEEATKEAMESKSKFTSMVSHELRSPLTVIMESINLVLEGLVGSVTDEQKDILDTAKSNIDRLGRLINNVLDFQKMEAGKMELDIKEYDINKIVLETSREMNFLAEEKDMSFTVNADDSIPMTKFDKDKIIQVLTNLLSNAVKFTEKGNISITTKNETDVMHVMVEDTGLGIQATDIPKLFQTFEQLGGGLGKKRGGTGLGLAISKEIIQAHKGNIWAESQPGKGSILHFTLPIK